MTLTQLVSVIVLAALPVSELRGALPLAYLAFHWPLPFAFVLTVVINALTGIFVFLLLEPVSFWLRRYIPPLAEFYDRVVLRVQERHSTRFREWRYWALFSFITLPLPFTGVWTGALLAHLGGFERYKTITVIVAAVTVAGFIVTGVLLLGDAVPALLRGLLLGRMH